MASTFARILVVGTIWYLSPLLAKDDYSITRPGNRYVDKTGDLYRDRIQPILAKRCVTCHACTSAPCQLNTTSYAGLVRGLSQENPHNQSVWRTFRDGTRTRLEDRFSPSVWRSLGFYPVLPQAGRPPEQSLLYLALNHESPAFVDGEAEDQARTLSLLTEEKFECPLNPKEYREFREDYALARMPLGCSELPPSEKQQLIDWILNGAPGPQGKGLEVLTEPTETSATRGDLEYVYRLVYEFEAFLNPSEGRRIAVARYLFEHLYAMNLYFADNPGEFYRIVRSRTPSPEPIDLVVTEFVTDDPHEAIFYRLEKVDKVIELKRHIPLQIGPAFISEMDEIFLNPALDDDWGNPWAVHSYPNNPFEWFQTIPGLARGRFVERYAKKMMQVVARGAICHGSQPSYVSPDYAWFMVLKPESDPTVMIPALGKKNAKGQPDFSDFYAHPHDTRRSLVYPPNYPWRAKSYNRIYLNGIDQLHPGGIGVEDISDVDLFFAVRHETSLEFYSAKDVSVPGYTEYKILWSYADYENFYYRTSVHYKYYGSVAHKFDAFYAVIQRRSLGEYMYALLQPDYNARQKLLRWFTTLRGRLFYQIRRTLLRYDLPERTSKEPAQPLALVSQKILRKFARYQNDPDKVHFHSSLRSGLKVELQPTIHHAEEFEQGLRTLVGKRGTFARYVPKLVHIRFDRDHLYSFFVHRGHRNDKIIAMEAKSLLPEFDQLNVAKGLVGAFPYMFFDIHPTQARSFIEGIAGLRSADDWQELVGRFGIQREGPEFYPFLDWMHGWISRNLGDLGGLLDIRYYGL